MDASRPPRRVAVSVLCAALGVVALSCSSRRVDVQAGQLTSGSFRELTRVTVHLVDGSVIDDVFLWIDDDQLVCMSHVFEMGTVDYIECAECQESGVADRTFILFVALATALTLLFMHADFGFPP